jgi:hypothetical protein
MRGSDMTEKRGDVLGLGRRGGPAQILSAGAGESRFREGQ